MSDQFGSFADEAIRIGIGMSFAAYRFLSVTVMTSLAIQIVEVRAQDEEHLGITEYEIACMPCHGVEGWGDGPMSERLKTPPADLTRIAKANGGKFPAKKVAEMIDGRVAMSSHMRREMPVWGDRYRIATEPGESLSTINERARAQIDALVNYLRTIQEK